MKCIVVFLVLSLVVLMAEPGECFFKHLLHVGNMIHGLLSGHHHAEQQQQQEEQFDKRGIDYRPGRQGFQ
uniref:pleurocidin-like peptide WF3 n=1 Tax=Semicossyphus pulcher TaxID=241346 RepID=UPI0037E9AD05